MIPLRKDSEIIPLYLSGKNAPQIKEILGVSASHVYDVLRRNKIKADPSNSGIAAALTEKQKIDIIELYIAGKSAPELGRIFNVGGHWIRRFLKKNEVKLRPRGERSGELSSKWRGGLTKNREYQNLKKREYQKNRLKNDPLFKLEMSLRNRVNSALRSHGYKKQSKVYFLLGADFEIIKKYIESQFLDGMSWQNHGSGHGKWNIDHIVPCAAAVDQFSLLRIFHYKNLRPLWWLENIKKGSLHNGMRYRKIREKA